MAKTIIRLPVIDPRHYQYAFWRAMDNGCTRAVKSWPRRGGKDISDFQFLVREALRRKGTYYYYFPTLELAKKALWDNIVEFYSFGECVAAGSMIDILCPPRIRQTKNNSDYFIRLINGSIIKIGGTDKLDVVGMNGYGYVFSEWQSQKKDAFGYISPILRENGGWALFNGTMRGQNNHLYQDIQRTKGMNGWFSEWLTPEITREYFWINEAEGISVNADLKGKLHAHTLRPYQNIQDLVDAGEISFTLARQEYLNDARGGVDGGYYGHELKTLENRVGIKSIDPFRQPVYTFWDLGGISEESDTTSITFAQIDLPNKNVNVIDYYENKGKLRGHYWEYIASLGYDYGGHYYPHDGKKHNSWNGESSADTAERVHGAKLRYVPKTNSISNDIEIVRRNIGTCSFDENRTQQLLSHLRNYHEREATGKPCHANSCQICGGASHGADSFRTMMMAIHLDLVEPYLLKNDKDRRMFWNDNTESANEYIDECFIA